MPCSGRGVHHNTKTPCVRVLNFGMESEGTASTQSDEEEETSPQTLGNFESPDGLINKCFLWNRTFDFDHTKESAKARKKFKKLERLAFGNIRRDAPRCAQTLFAACNSGMPSEEDIESERKRAARYSAPILDLRERWDWEFCSVERADLPPFLPDMEVILPILAYDLLESPFNWEWTRPLPLPTTAQLRAVQKHVDRAHRDKSRASVRQQKRDRPPRRQKHVANRRAPQKWR